MGISKLSIRKLCSDDKLDLLRLESINDNDNDDGCEIDRFVVENNAASAGNKKSSRVNGYSKVSPSINRGY